MLTCPSSLSSPSRYKRQNIVTVYSSLVIVQVVHMRVQRAFSCCKLTVTHSKFRSLYMATLEITTMHKHHSMNLIPVSVRTQGVRARHGNGSSGEHISGCLGKHGLGEHGSGSGSALALWARLFGRARLWLFGGARLLFFGHGSSGDHGSGSLGTALRASTALVLRGSMALALEALHSFGPTPHQQTAFLKAPNLQNTSPTCRLYLLNTT